MSYVWINTVMVPDHKPLVRTAYTRYLPAVDMTKLPWDYTILDSGAGTIKAEFMPWYDNENYKLDPSKLPATIMLWPPNKKTFMCTSGVYKTEPDPITGMWIKARRGLI
jgi:hypothetical protein